MISAIAGWVRTLLALALVGNVAEWLLPAGSIRRQARLVVGLILLAALIGPVWRLMLGVSHASWVYTGGAGAAAGADLVREEEADVGLILASLPTVRAARVTEAGGVVTVTLTTAGPSPPSVAAAARDAVEEVMSTPAARIRVVVIATQSHLPAGSRP